MFLNRTLRALFAIAIATAFAACDWETANPVTPSPTSVPVPVLQSVSVSGPQSIVAGQSFSVSLRGTYSDGSSSVLGAGVTWTSSNLNVLTVNTLGVGSASNAGTSSVTGTFEGKSANLVIIVTAPPAPVAYWDPQVPGTSGTQQYGMHVCPAGTAITRVSGGKGNYNQFYCAQVTTNVATVADVQSRGERQVLRSHTCPQGYYLRGMNIAENRFTCSWHPGLALSSRDSDITSSQGSQTLACAPGQVAVGFNENEQRILCLPMSGL